MDSRSTIGRITDTLNQTVAIGAASVQSSVFDLGSAIPTATAVRLVATVDCFIAIGSAPVAAAATSVFLPAGIPEHFSIADDEKVAVISASAATGSLYASVLL